MCFKATKHEFFTPWVMYLFVSVLYSFFLLNACSEVDTHFALFEFAVALL